MTYGYLKSNQGEIELSSAVSPRFEVFFALKTALDDRSPLQETRLRRVRTDLSDQFVRDARALCDQPVVWANLADALTTQELAGGFEQILEALSKVDLRDFQVSVLEGAIHSVASANALADGEKTLEEALKKVPESKKEWLGFLGLYPFDVAASYSQFLQRVIDAPGETLAEIHRLLDVFWSESFCSVWNSIQSELTASQLNIARRLQFSSFADVLRQVQVRIDVDEDARTIGAVRGGYIVSFDDVERIHFLPSAFNDNCLWSAFENSKTGKTILIAPYFDPAVGRKAVSASIDGAQNESGRKVEPALVFQALGNSTRFAMISTIAKENATAADLSRRLDLSRATISHHVQHLRAADLIEEVWAGGSVSLSLKKSTLAALSDVALAEFCALDPS